MDPQPIKKLEQDVINRIAAGEVIQRPANALKELIENSLDAKSTNIQITVKNGGLKFLQIQDNGTGIRKEDFSIACERFTTSKLQEFEDLQKIATYGFRGEALASISHVAHLSITSKTRNDICANIAEYTDSKLKYTPKPLAGNQGTIITVEDLFYNMNVRRKALRSPAEEYQKIADIVGKYAIHNAKVGFALKKYGENNDIRTPVKSNHIDNIRIVYGGSIAKALVEFELKNDDLEFTCKGYITKVDYTSKKFQFILFINHRLVDSQSLKKCIDTVYQTYLPKHCHSFVYLSLELNPNNIDVNVHPTKHEVHFLNESQIIECITEALEQKLLGSNRSRVFYTQSKLLNVEFETSETLKQKMEKTTTEAPKYMVRTDHNIQKLDKFFEIGTKKPDPQTNKNDKRNANMSLTEEEYEKQHQYFLKEQENFENKFLDKTVDSPMETDTNDTKNNIEDVVILSDKTTSSEESMANIIESSQKSIKELPKKTVIKEPPKKTLKEISSSQEAKRCEKPLCENLIKKITKVETKLSSILDLRKAVEDNCHRTLRETFAQHVFVGSINEKQALIQYNTQLLLCNTQFILEELFYQIILYNFQNFDCYRFEEGMSVKSLALIGLDLEETGWTEEDGSKEELAERVSEILKEKGPMLYEYFSIEIDSDGMLRSLPILLENYIPDPRSLPIYLISLATEVEWETEKQCFETFSRETAQFYAKVSKETNEKGKTMQWVVEYVLYPAIKDFFLPPKSFTENAAVLEIANLPNLYKVFERC